MTATSEPTGRAAHPREPGGRPPLTYALHLDRWTFTGCKVDDPDDVIDRWNRAEWRLGQPAPVPAGFRSVRV